MKEAEPSIQPAIEMIDVAVATASAPQTVAIQNVNWTVALGDYWIIGGLPGSGKSDLLATAAGLLRPLRGVHRLFGEDLAQLPEEETIEKRLRVGLVFSNEGRLFHHLTVSENLALPVCYHKNCAPAEARDRVKSVLEFTGLSSIAHNTPRTINRNLRPRVALARALALNPEVVLLDDPLRGADPIQAKWWLEFLSSLCSGHPLRNHCRTTLVIAAESFRPWTRQGKSFALINEGRWETLGGPDELSRREEPLLRDLLTSDF